ncbi:MAG: HAD family hydrolase [Treponema sp.]|jgi:putative hydrolase of the HAD superfamily|nr:HAD family hydrolase [Treponema sp.]
MTDAERRLCVKIIAERSSPLFPLPPELPPPWDTFSSDFPAGIKAFIFDLYGTLFISGAGEIAARRETPPESGSSVRAGALEPMTAFFRAKVAAAHKTAKAGGRTFPEIRVEEIWAGYDGSVPAGLGQSRSPVELALRYELAVNPVYPMPGAAETIAALRRRGFTLGIISNAQFFSPLLFEAFFGRTPAEMGFDPRLLVWSFEQGEAKPSVRLFEKTAAVLGTQGIEPGEAVYIGNDMKNDIVPAAAAGFKTALFAGDGRSLRLREMLPIRAGGDGGAENLIPSVVIRDLQSLTEIR